MRIVSVLLFIVALASAGVWAFAEFNRTAPSGASSTETETADIRIAEADVPEAPAERQAAETPPQPGPEAASDPTKDAAIPPSAETAAAGGEGETFDIDPSFGTESVSAAPQERLAVPAAAEAASAAAASSLSEQFKSRQVAYNRPPATMILNRPIDVSLVIDAREAPDAAESLEGFPGTVVERDVDLSDVVSAQLTGVGFDIVSQSIGRQKLSGTTQNRWQWRVTPTETGQRTLILEIFGYAQGSLDAEPLDAYRDDIMVEVRDLDRLINLAQSVQPVFGIVAAIAGALSVLVGFLRLRVEKRRVG